MDGPDQIGPDYRPKQTWGDKTRRLVKAFTTKCVGEIDSSALGDVLIYP